MNTPITYTEDEVIQILNEIITDIRNESKKLDEYIDNTKLTGQRANIELAKQVGLDKAIVIIIAKSISVVTKSITYIEFADLIEKDNQLVIPTAASGYGKSLPTYSGPVEISNGIARPKEPEYTNFKNKYLSAEEKK